MCSLACKIKKNQRKTARKEKNWRKNEKEDVSRIMPLTNENKEKNQKFPRISGSIYAGIFYLKNIVILR